MKYDLRNKFEVQKIATRLTQLINNEKFVELKVIHPARSNQQNKYLHVVLGYFAAEYGEKMEYVKQEIFKKIVSPDIFKTEYVNKVTGEVREDWKSTADLDSGELTLAIDRFRDYASKEAGLYIPEPHEEDAMRWIETEIERTKQYQ
jgi:hypothetical protein